MWRDGWADRLLGWFVGFDKFFAAQVFAYKVIFAVPYTIKHNEIVIKNLDYVSFSSCYCLNYNDGSI